MNKLNKINNILVLLVLLFTVLSPVSVYAENLQSINSETLSYEEALKMALKESKDLKNLKLEDESNSIKNDDLFDKFGYSLMNPEVLQLMKLQKKDSLEKSLSEKMENYINEGLAFKLKSTFNNINLMNKDIELKKMQLENSIKKRNTIALKLEYGMESKTNLTTKDIELNQLRKDLESLEKDLDEQYIELNKLIGADRFTKYKLEDLNFDYVQLKDNEEDINLKANRAITSDITIWGKEQKLDIQRLDVDFYALNYISGLPSSMQLDPTPYKALDLDVKIAANDLEQSKKDLKDSVISKYNTIKKLETTYENTTLKLKELEEKKRVLEVAINTGTAIKQDYDDLLLGISEVNNGINKIKSQHSLLVEMYNNPLLAGGNIN